MDVVKAQMDEVMGVGELDKMDQAILAARTKGDQRQLIAALEIKTKRLVSHLPLYALANEHSCINANSGIHAGLFDGGVAVSNMSRSLQ